MSPTKRAAMTMAAVTRHPRRSGGSRSGSRAGGLPTAGRAPRSPTPQAPRPRRRPQPRAGDSGSPPRAPGRRAPGPPGHSRETGPDPRWVPPRLSAFRRRGAGHGTSHASAQARIRSPRLGLSTRQPGKTPPPVDGKARARDHPRPHDGDSGGIAQLVEHLIENQGVTGSSPVLATTPSLERAVCTPSSLRQ